MSRIMACAAALSTVTLLAAPFALPADAKEFNETRLVPVDDLDLSSESGVAAMNNRIKNAARDICGYGDWRRRFAPAMSRCIADVTHRAAPQTQAVVARAKDTGSRSAVVSLGMR